MPLPTQKLTDPTKNITYGTTIGAILQRGVPIVYKVPQHQRAYSWTAASVERYLLDLDFACEEGFPHNFGSLDLREDGFLKDAANPSNDAKIHHGGIGCPNYPIREVNDGQQRLTTIFLTFSAIASIKEQGGTHPTLIRCRKKQVFFLTNCGIKPATITATESCCRSRISPNIFGNWWSKGMVTHTSSDRKV